MEHPIKMDDLGVPLFSETSTLKFSFEKKKRKHQNEIRETSVRVGSKKMAAI